MGVIFGTLFVFVGIITIMAIVVESIEIYYDTKQRLRDEDWLD